MSYPLVFLSSLITALFVSSISLLLSLFFFFFNDTATTEIYTLSLHDALPIFRQPYHAESRRHQLHLQESRHGHQPRQDRKSTRLNSSHLGISYAVFCLKKKKKKKINKNKRTKKRKR